MFLWFRHSLCLLYGTGVSLPQSPTGGAHFTLLPSHTGHQDSWTCALCPCSFRAPSPPAHRLATPCTSHTVPLSTVTAGFLVTNRILTRRASCASGGLRGHLSSMCLLGLIVKCVLLSRGYCLRPSVYPRGSMFRLGHRAPSTPTLVLNHLHGLRRSIWSPKSSSWASPAVLSVYLL